MNQIDIENKVSNTVNNEAEDLKNYYNMAKSKIFYIQGQLEQVELSVELAKNMYNMYEKLVYTPNPLVLCEVIDLSNLSALEKQTNFLIFYMDTLATLYKECGTKYNVFKYGSEIRNIFTAQSDKHNNTPYAKCLSDLQQWLSDVNNSIEKYKATYYQLKTNTF